MNTFDRSILQTPVAVLGAGSWGTALAILMAENGQPVRLWGHNTKHVRQMQQDRCNQRYLPQVTFPSNLQAIDNLSDALFDTQDIFIVVPSHAFEDLLVRIRPLLIREARLIFCTKGLVMDGQLLHTAANHLLKKNYAQHLAVLSGPSFAKEVANKLPTAVTVATTDTYFADALSIRLNNSHFRIYTSRDITGVEICGVVKNVLAIAAGIVDGLQLGANALSALITRGLVEMQRLGVALGGKPATFTGLAGLGDLVLSCTDNQSRNRRFGGAIAAGKTPAKAIKEIGQAVEGYYNIEAVYQLAQHHQIEMPITEQVYQIIYQKKSPMAAIQTLLAREPKKE